MAWNEPGKGQQGDPWNRKRPSGGAPNLDDLLKQLKSRFGKFGNGAGGIITVVVVLIVLSVLFGSYTIVGARAGLRQPEQGWTLSLFVRNLFDERYAQFKFAPYLLSNASAPGIDASGAALSTESFRFVGLTLDYEF